MSPLDNLRRLVAGWRGEWRVDAHEGITLSHGGEEWPIGALDGDATIVLVELLNAIRPAVDGATAEIERLTGELAAARAVPPDVEAAIKSTVDGAEEAGRCAALGHAYPITKAPFWTVPRLKDTITRAISDATAATRADLAAAVHELGEMTRAYHVANKRTGLALTAKRLCDSVGGVWNVEYDSWMSQVHDVLNHLHADADGTVRDGRASKPATVGGLLATAPVGSIVEWKDGQWFRRCVVGRMVSSRWIDGTHRVWTGYAFLVDAEDLRHTARLVPAHLADADPASRGEIAPIAPRCSCTREAGDSRCDAHPSCSECGDRTSRNVDDCADHCQACASLRRGDAISITSAAAMCSACKARGPIGEVPDVR